MKEELRQRVETIVDTVRRIADDPVLSKELVELMAPLMPNAGLTYRAVAADQRLRDRLKAKGVINFNVFWSNEPITVEEAVKACHDLLDAEERGEFTPMDIADLDLDCPKTNVAEFVKSLK